MPIYILITNCNTVYKTLTKHEGELMLKEIERSTLANQENQNFLLRYFSRLHLDQKLDILNRHRKVLFLRKQQKNNLSINTTSYIALILAIKSYIADEQKLTKKQFDDMTLEEIRELSVHNIKKFKMRKKYAPSKRDKVLGLWSVIKTLREEKISFRDISLYLKKYHKFEIGHSLIHSMWQEMEGLNDRK